MKIFILGMGAATVALGSASAAQQAAPSAVTRAQFVAKADAGFKEMDTNHDGSLSTTELQAVQTKELQQQRAALQAKLQAEFKQLDTNKDGQLSPQEFAAAGANLRPTGTPAQVLANLDTNKDGKVSADEFRAPRVRIFDAVDANHDGTASVEEQRAAAQRR